ncbi:MAG: hypothetical protein NVSMB42_08230 [Herpetosiphon sp.]
MMAQLVIEWGTMTLGVLVGSKITMGTRSIASKIGQCARQKARGTAVRRAGNNEDLCFMLRHKQ